MSLTRYALSTLLILTPACAMALETGQLKREAGATESVLGARVESVEELGGEQQKILVSIPAQEGGQAPEIEEVIVTAPEIKPEVKVKPRYEFVDDYAQDRYGFVIYLGKNKNLPFRIYFNDDSALNPTTQQLR